MSKVEIDYPREGVCRLSLNRPDAMNAIDDETRALLKEGLKAASGDKAVRAVVIAAIGPNFSAGGDIRFLQELDKPAFQQFHRHLIDLLLYMGNYDKPLVAAVQGSCAGGAMGIALACDYVIASASSRYIIPFMRIGLTPDMGLIYWLSRRAGMQRARTLILDDAPIKVKTALALGLVDRMVGEGELEEAALALSGRLAGLAPNALRQTRRLLNCANFSLEAYADAEIEAARDCLGGPEFVEGTAAFFEKRTPVWPD